MLSWNISQFILQFKCKSFSQILYEGRKDFDEKNQTYLAALCTRFLFCPPPYSVYILYMTNLY